MNQSQFLSQFARWFEPARLTELARRSCWLIRQGKIDAFEFLVGLVFGQMSALGLSLNAQAGCYTQPVSRQAVDQRYHQRTVDFFLAAFNECLRQTLAHTPQPSLNQSLAEHFNAVHLLDSCSFDCPRSLAQIYPGCGGDASAANCKILLRYEYLQGQFQPLALLPGKRSDSGLTEELPRLLRPNELLINDKGFFKLKVLRQIDQAKAYFLMPLPRSVTLWLAQPQGPSCQLDLADALRHTDQNLFQWPSVFLGSGPEAVCVRIVAFRLSQQSADRHRAALRESQRKMGRTPTAEALELAGWLILFTNAPVDKLPSQALSHLYRVRWQIELVFKQCKSLLRVDQTQAHKNQYRVQCEIWARLIAALVFFAWHSQLQVVCWAQRRREISFAQVAAQFQQQGMTLAHALIEGGQPLRERLWKFWRHLLKTTVKGRQRSRKTTWENLNQHWPPLASQQSTSP